MKNLSKRVLLFFIVLIIGLVILFSYFFASTRAGRITSNAEYIKSLEEASRGKRLPGTETADSNREQVNAAESEPKNLFEEIILQIKALFGLN